MQREEAVKLVNKWIADHHRYLKDGGGSTGMHAVPRDELVKRISELLGDGKPVVTPDEDALMNAGWSSTSDMPRKPKKAKKSAAQGD